MSHPRKTPAPAAAAYTDPGTVHASIGHVWNRLATLTDEHTRAKRLLDAADLYCVLAEIHAIDAELDLDIAREDGDWDLCEAAASIAQLLDALADVEFVVAGELSRRYVTETLIERDAGPILDRMAATGDLTQRALLLKPLHDAVAGVVGEHVAEVLCGLPYAPGMTGWHRDPAIAPRPRRPWFVALAQRLLSHIR